MLKYTAYGAMLDGQQGSSGTFSGPRVTMCVACCVRVIDPSRLCRLCKTVEDMAATESEFSDGHAGNEDATETGQSSQMKTPVQLAFAKYDTNKRGVLGRWEVSRMLQENGVPGDFSAVFKRFDEDRSGGISLPEFQMMWRQHGLASYVQVAEIEVDGAADQAPLSQRMAARVPPIDFTAVPTDNEPTAVHLRGNGSTGRGPAKDIIDGIDRTDRPPGPPADSPPAPPDDDDEPSKARPQENRPTGRDPVEDIFVRFNRNNDNMLDMEEVREMLEVISA
jgi:hypothetical protein